LVEKISRFVAKRRRAVDAETPSTTPDTLFVPGNRCLLLLMGQRYLVTIQKAEDDSLSVSFPIRDFPVEGMRVDLEFHDTEGYTCFESEVMRAPKEVGDSLVLRRPPEFLRNYHRGSWRVPVDFKTSLKGHVHPRRLNVPVVNLSTGGMLILTDAPMEVGEMLEAKLPVPTLEGNPVTCKVVHRADAAQSLGGLVQVGCTFVSPDPTSVKAISDYILERLKELGPEHSPFGNQNTESDA
jgi:hypothetical protein